MIVKHEGTNLIMNPKRENFFEFFVQALASIRRVKDCFEITEGIIASDIDGFDGLDELEQNKFIDVNALESFAYKGFSKYQSIAVVIRYALGTIAGFNKMVSDFVDDGLFLAEDECEQLNKMLNQIISELVYAVYYEFDIPTHAQKLEAGEDYVDEIIKMYCDSYSISVKDVYLTQNALCFATTLIGPGENETVAKVPSFPYIVVEVAKCDKNVVFK